MKLDKVNRSTAWRGWGPGQRFWGLADRWNIKLLLSLTTDTENNTERHTNVCTVGRNMTHRKFLSLVHVHDQDSWRRRVPSFARNAFVSLQDLWTNGWNVRLRARCRIEKRKCALSDSNLLQVVGAGQQGQPLQSEMNPSRLGVFQSEPLWRQQQPWKDESAAHTAPSGTENSVSDLHHQQQWTSSQFLDLVWSCNGK